MRVFELRDIKNPRQIKEQLSNLVEVQRNLKRVSGRELMIEDSENIIEGTKDEN